MTQNEALDLSNVTTNVLTLPPPINYPNRYAIIDMGETNIPPYSASSNQTDNGVAFLGGATDIKGLFSTTTIVSATETGSQAQKFFNECSNTGLFVVQAGVPSLSNATAATLLTYEIGDLSLFQDVDNGSVGIQANGTLYQATNIDMKANKSSLALDSIGLASAFSGLSGGSFAVEINGALTNFTGLSFSTGITMSGIATKLNDKFTSANATIQAVYSSTTPEITIESISKGKNYTLGYLQTVSPATGTDISGATYLNGTTSATATLTQGAGVSNYSQVASAMQTALTLVNAPLTIAIQTATSTANTTNALFTTTTTGVNATISYLTTSTTNVGTDLSGGGYLNGASSSLPAPLLKAQGTTPTTNYDSCIEALANYLQAVFNSTTGGDAFCDIAIPSQWFGNASLVTLCQSYANQNGLVKFKLLTINPNVASDSNYTAYAGAPNVQIVVGASTQEQTNVIVMGAEAQTYYLPNITQMSNPALISVTQGSQISNLNITMLQSSKATWLAYRNINGVKTLEIQNNVMQAGYLYTSVFAQAYCKLQVQQAVNTLIIANNTAGAPLTMNQTSVSRIARTVSNALKSLASRGMLLSEYTVSTIPMSTYIQNYTGLYEEGIYNGCSFKAATQDFIMQVNISATLLLF